MTVQQLNPLLDTERKWTVAIIQTSFRQPAAVGGQSKISIVNDVLVIVDDDGNHPFKVDKEENPLPVRTVINIEIAHIHSVDYFTEKKIISAKRPGIIVP